MRDCCRRSGHRTISAARANAHDDAFRLSIAAAKNEVLCFGKIHVRLGTSSRKELMKFCLIVSLCMCACVRVITNFILILPRVTLHPRTANQVGEDSRCRGGIVHIRVGCSRALLVRRHCSTALWRFRVSTSNSPNGRSRPHSYTQLRYIIILTLNKIFEYVEMTIFSRPMRQFSESQGALTSSCKYLRHSR